jgi:hypothetical protein
VNNPELDGYDFSESLLTALSPSKRKPGRPPEISDEMLVRNRNDLLFALEESWASVGWELQHAESAADIRAALGRIQGINCSSLEPFRLEYRRETTFSQLEFARDSLKRASVNLKDAQALWAKCKELFELAQRALKKESDPQTHSEIEGKFQEIETAFRQAEKRFGQAQIRRMLIGRVVLQREAAFAQSELLKFILSDRYKSTPLTFANAMAGLPIIRWRYSTERCRKFQDRLSRGLT